MEIKRRSVIKLLLGFAAGLNSLSSWSQGWPDRSIKLVLGYTTGGASDATATRSTIEKVSYKHKEQINNKESDEKDII